MLHNIKKFTNIVKIIKKHLLIEKIYSKIVI